MLNAGFDDDSGAAVCLSTGMLGVVEVVAVYFEVLFVGEVSFRLRRFAVVLRSVLVQICVELDRWRSTELYALVLFCFCAY